MSDFKAQGGLRTIVSGEADDLILVAYSFEPRSLAVVNHLAKDYMATCGIVYVNDEVLNMEKRAGINSGFDEMKYRLADHVQSVRPANGSLLKPSVQLESFQELFSRRDSESGAVKTVTIDATTFNRETLLILFGLLDTFFPDARKRVLYVSPVSYGDWLSAGFQQVHNVIGLGGLQDPSKKTLLVVLYGYEHHRAIKTIEEYEPAKVLLGFGGTPTEIDFLKRNMDELGKVKMLALSQQEVEEFAFPADSIADCAARLQDVVRPYVETHNIVVAPMSTKLSTIAAYLLAKQNPQVQVSYCVPGEYNIESYSKGAKTVFTEELVQT